MMEVLMWLSLVVASAIGSTVGYLIAKRLDERKRHDR